MAGCFVRYCSAVSVFPRYGFPLLDCCFTGIRLYAQVADRLSEEKEFEVAHAAREGQELRRVIALLEDENR